ncbi:MAG: hypothetical protein EA343_08270 [Nodularia sp. (in: Bacteria)]|nr:MAG: hypothetical protein EA343_08270 [Nodularia sp. (in: cyanobacteria)]
MPLISKHLLINLSFYQPLDNSNTQWPDTSDPGLKAIAEECTPSTLDLLGSCLQINSGGQLTVPNLSQRISEDLIGDTKQLTIEFWVKPDTAAMGGGQKFILQGPVRIWMEGNDLHWSIGQNSYEIQDAEGLHHWAIVVNKTVNSAQIAFFKDGVEVTNQAQPINDGVKVTGELNETLAATDLVIGAKENGWTGKLAHLRIWKTALNANQLQQNRQRDVTAHAAFKETTAIRWQLVNADDEPSLYIHSPEPQELRLELENVTENTTLVIPQSTETASFDNNLFHFCLVFRPGTIALPLLESDAEKFIQPIREKNPGWSISLNKWDVQDCICFLRTDIQVELTSEKRSLTLFLPGIAAEPGSGSRPTTVGLRYQGLTILENPSHPLDGHRAQPLSILYREPSIRKPPLEVGVVGAPVVLNNGTTTCLTLYIKNINRNASQTAAPLILGNANTQFDKEPKFILKIDTLTELVETEISDLKKGDKYYAKKIDPKTKAVIAEDTFKCIEIENGRCIVENLNPSKTESENRNPPERKSIESTTKILKFGVASIDAKGLGDGDDLMNTNLKLKHDQLHPSYRQASGGIVFWKISPKQITGENGNREVSLKPNEIILLSLENLKTTAPPGRSVLRLCYEDIDRYGEGEFEIPIDRVPAIPAKLSNNGAGYGLAMGFDPRVGKSDPNADALSELLSIKKLKGNGDAVRIENNGSGSGLTVDQKGKGLAAKFSGGSGVEISNKLILTARNHESNSNDTEIANSLLSVSQLGNRSAAHIIRNDDNNGESYGSTEVQTQENSLYVQPLVHLKLNQGFYAGHLVDSSGNNRGATITGSLQVVNDDKFSRCLNFDGASGNHIVLNPKVIPSGSKVTFSFWAWGAESLPANRVVRVQDPNDNRVIMIHLPWSDNKIYFDCGNEGQNYDRISKKYEANDFKGGWIHWAFIKDAEIGEMKIYKNGEIWHSENGKNKPLPPAETATLGIDYQGKLAHFRSYDQALSQDQIKWQKEQDKRYQQEQDTEQKVKDDATPAVCIENSGHGSGLTVTQHSDGLAAKFSGGSGVEITGNLQVRQRIRDKTGEIMPVGAVIPFAGVIAPDGWLLCNGQQVMGEKYKDLAKILFGEEKFVFNLPDYRERFLVGASTDTDYTLGASGGQVSVALTKAQMPIHSHAVQVHYNPHTLSGTMKQKAANIYRNGENIYHYNLKESSLKPAQVTEKQEGSGDSHENRPPFVALNYIIKY